MSGEGPEGKGAAAHGQIDTSGGSEEIFDIFMPLFTAFEGRIVCVV